MSEGEKAIDGCSETSIGRNRLGVKARVESKGRRKVEERKPKAALPL